MTSKSIYDQLEKAQAQAAEMVEHLKSQERLLEDGLMTLRLREMKFAQTIFKVGMEVSPNHVGWDTDTDTEIDYTVYRGIIVSEVWWSGGRTGVPAVEVAWSNDNEKLMPKTYRVFDLTPRALIPTNGR